MDNIELIKLGQKIKFERIKRQLSQEQLAELSNLSDVWSKYMGRICYGKANEPEKFVAEFRAALKQAGIEKCIAELQKQLDDLKKKAGIA